MGGGKWTSESFANYSSYKGMCVTSSGDIDMKSYSTGQVFKNEWLHESLDPKNVIRECRDSEEHPITVPVIIALDVTGSMGDAAIQVAGKLNVIIKDILDKTQDAEVMIMGIGDLYYDDCPLQVSQFESDIRIAKHLDNIYFEGGGGGNDGESYTAAWWFGAHKTKLDCWKRGEKGIIITLGDEPLKIDIPVKELNRVIGESAEHRNSKALNPKNIYEDVKDKYNVFHIHVLHDSRSNAQRPEIEKSFADVIGKQNVFSCEIDGIHKTISNIINDNAHKQMPTNVLNGVAIVDDDTPATVDKSGIHRNANGEIVW